MHVINNGREMVRVVLTARRLIGSRSVSQLLVLSAHDSRDRVGGKTEKEEACVCRMENGEPIVRFLLERRTGGSSIGRFLNIPTTQLPE